jgi:hypothetical protein
MVCCTAMGTSTRPTVEPSASSRVTGNPAVNSGDSASPRRRVVHADCWVRPLSVIVAMAAPTLPNAPDTAKSLVIAGAVDPGLGRTGRGCGYPGAP